MKINTDNFLQIEYPPKTEFGIKAVSNVILVRGSWILGLLVMHLTMKSIVPVCKTFDGNRIFRPKNRHFEKKTLGGFHILRQHLGGEGGVKKFQKCADILV